MMMMMMMMMMIRLKKNIYRKDYVVKPKLATKK